MSRIFPTKTILLCSRILLLGSIVSDLLADTAGFDRYALPRDKRIFESCKQSALVALPGKIQSFQFHNTAEGFHYRFEIEAPDGVFWVLVCEGATQKIIRMQRQE